MNRATLVVLLVVLVVVGISVTVLLRALTAPSIDDETIARNNHAVGLMSRFDYDEAAMIFAELVEEHPDWLDVRVNLAIAVLNRQGEGDEAEALRMLEEIVAEDETHLRARYCAGLLHYRQGGPSLANAKVHLQYVLARDPNDPYVRYFLGQTLEQTGQTDEALEQYRKVMEMDQYLRSAYYRTAQLLLRSGDDAEGHRLMDEFSRLEKNPRQRTIDFIYSKMGVKAETLAVDVPESPVQSRPPGALFGPPVRLLELVNVTWARPRDDRSVSVTACDMNGDGRIDVFVAGGLSIGGDTANAVIMGRGVGFHLDLDHPLTSVPDVNAALWGNFDNDAYVDVYLCRRGPNQLWRQTASGTWTNVTDTTLTANGDFDTVDGAFFDADHDIDLDIFCVNADGPNELFSNNNDGTFRPIAADSGIAGDGRSSRQVVVGDLDGDRDADILVLNASPPHELYWNDRLWSYHAHDPSDELLKAPITGAVAGDIDADGGVDLFTAASGMLQRWALNDDGTFSANVLGAASELLAGEIQLALDDVEGDGVLDLLVSGANGWGVVEPDMGMGVHYDDTITPWGWTVLLHDAKRGPALLTFDEGGPTLIGPGSGRFPFTAVKLTGREDPAAGPPPMRSNQSGIGVRVAARVDSIWAVRSTFRESSGPGQGLQPMSLGLAGRDHLDFVVIDWPDGVFQSEVHGVSPLPDTPLRDFRAGNIEVIEEIQRIKGSCPVVFAWNGTKYVFVSDVLGVGGLGFMVAPGEYGEPRPWERLLLPEGAIAARDGAFEIKIGEPMEEACYLDAARLVTYDLPAGWSVTMDERFAITGPTPTGEPRFYRRAVQPVSAVNDRGEDVTKSVLEIDGTAAPVGAHDMRFIGRLAGEHVLTLEFAEPLTDGTGEPMLVVDGWIEYPYSQTMFGAWQADATYDAPTLEARDTDGRWHVLLEKFGYPAGMPRQMSLPLPPLPEGTTALRLRTNQEIYWDRVIVAWSEPCPEAVRTTLPLRSAVLGRPGFATRVPQPQSRPEYDYDRRKPFWDARQHRGFYTRFGDVDELLAERDDALTIFGPGEETHLVYDESPLRVLPAGWTRRFVLEVEGWCKDMDLFTKEGETLAPRPASAGGPSEAVVEMHRRYQTRFESGR